MNRWLSMFALLMLPGSGPAARADEHAAGSGFACNLRALTAEQRKEHAALASELFASVQEQKELPDGYAFRLPAARWLDAARWAELERRCCPFFAFQLTAAPDNAPLWLRLTGRQGVKEFMKEELGID